MTNLFRVIITSCLLVVYRLARDIANGVHIVRLPPNSVEGGVVANDHAEPGLVVESTGFQLGDFSVSSITVSELFRQ